MSACLLNNLILPYTYGDVPYFGNGTSKNASYITFDEGDGSCPNVGKATASKIYTLKCGTGVSITCQELSSILVMTQEGEFLAKNIRDVVTSDFILQPHGYFSKYFEEEYCENLGESLFYIVGLWYGRGERFYSSKPCVRFDTTKDYDICQILDSSSFVDSVEAHGNYKTYFLTKSVCTMTTDERFCKYFKLKDAYQFTKGVVDGCGYVYFGESHNTDLGVKFQEKSRFVTQVVQMVFQSLGVMSYCSEPYVTQLFNANMYCYDLRIRGKESVGNFCKYFGFTNSFKNSLAVSLFNSIEKDDFVPSFVGTYLLKNHPELNDSLDNLDDAVCAFLQGKDGLSRSLLTALPCVDDILIRYLKEGGVLSTVKNISIATGFFKSQSISLTNSTIINSYYIS